MQEETSKELERDELGRLKPGQVSLNPNGRPMGSLGFATKWRKFVIKIADKNNVKPEDIEDELLSIAYQRARKGDFQFYKDILDRVHGKAVQEIKQTTDLTIVDYGDEAKKRLGKYDDEE